MVSLLEKAVKYKLWDSSPEIFFKDITGLTPIPQQKRLLRLYSDDSVNRIILSAPVSSGKTFTMAVLSLWTATIHSYVKEKPYDILIISGSLNQAKILYEYVRKLLKHPWMSEFVRGESIQTRTDFKTDSTIRVTASSETAFYGIHPNVLIMDEACIIPDVILRDGLSRIAPHPDAKLILASTPYNPLSEFVKIWMDEKRYPEWKRFTWDVKSCNWIPEEVVEEARKLLPISEFKAKWEAVPISAMDTYFPIADLKECLTEYKPARVEGAETSIGIDWGVEHPTVFEVVQYLEPNIIHLREQVWHGKSAEFIQRQLMELVDEYKPTYVYSDSSAIWENQRLEPLLRPKGITFSPIVFKNEKLNMLGFLKSLIEQHTIKIYEGEIDLIRELSNYTLETKRKDDRVDALMLACYPFSKYKSRVAGSRIHLIRRIPL